MENCGKTEVVHRQLDGRVLDDRGCREHSGREHGDRERPRRPSLPRRIHIAGAHDDADDEPAQVRLPRDAREDEPEREVDPDHRVELRAARVEAPEHHHESPEQTEDRA